MQATVIELVHDRETKRTNRYAEVPEDGAPEAIGTLYIQKHATGNPAPQRLRVTVEEA